MALLLFEIDTTLELHFKAITKQKQESWDRHEQ
jgi:hypothetical protein